jgi:DNA-binding response OmpR family regulator
MSSNILIIDDDTELCALLSEFLHLEGFNTHTVHDGIEAVSHCRTHTYDAVVLDIMLPGMQGLDVLRTLREFSNTPILMLTARGEDTDRILGLELGADDYLPKPCNPRELSARLRAILRRVVGGKASARPPATVTVGGTVTDAANRTASFNQQDLHVTSAEFNILRVLLAHAGQVVSKDVLHEQALGRALAAYDRSIDVHVSNLRKKMAAAGATNMILSVRGVGYQFAGEPNEANSANQG